MAFYFGRAQSKGFATLRNFPKSVSFWLEWAIWQSESRISSIYLEITAISLIYYSRKTKPLLFLASPGFEPTNPPAVRSDETRASLRPKVVCIVKNSCKLCTRLGMQSPWVFSQSGLFDKVRTELVRFIPRSPWFLWFIIRERRRRNNYYYFGFSGVWTGRTCQLSDQMRL